jgi:hypothetical protein
MFACCSRRSDNHVLPVAATPDSDATVPPKPQPAQSHAGLPVQESSPSKADLDTDAAAAASSTGAWNNPPNANVFQLKLRQGNGSTFALPVFAELTVGELMERISRHLGTLSVPLYSIRLIHKTTVLSLHAESTLGSFSINEDDTLMLVVVRHRLPRGARREGARGAHPPCSSASLTAALFARCFRR